MNNLFCSSYMKYLRDEFYIGQSEIADSLYISVSTYSKMEQGNKTIRNEDFEAVIRFYEHKKEGYSFCFEEEKKKQANALIRKCITAFVYRSQKDLVPELKAYLNDPSSLHSYAFFETKLIETTYEYFTDQEFQKRLPFLIQHMDLFDQTARSFIYDLQGLSKLRTYDESAIDCFQSAKALSVLIHIPGWLGLIDYHLIITYLRAMLPHKAFPLFEESGRDFQNAGAHRRILNLRFNQAQCLMKMKLYEEADQIHLNLLQTYDQVDTKRFAAMIYVNFSWSQFIQKHYQEAINLSRKAVELDYDFCDLYITLAYSFYKLGEIPSALAAIEQYKIQERTDDRSKMVLLFLEVLESFLLKKYETFEHQAQQLVPKLAQWKDLEIDPFVYEMLIAHYKKTDNEHALCPVLEKYIEYLKN